MNPTTPTRGLQVRAWEFALAGALLASISLTVPSWAAAQVGACVPGAELGIGPALLDNTEGERRLGAEIFASACSSGHDLRRTDDGSVAFTPPEPFPFSWTLGADGRFSVIHDGDLVPVENHVTGRAGISVSLSKPAVRQECTDDMTVEECAQLAAEEGATEFDLGFVSLSGRGRYESSLGFSEQHLAGGAELRYGHLRGYIPSVVVTYDVVKPLASDARDAATVSDDAYWRWMVQGYVYHRVGRVVGEVEGAVFKANGLASALDALGWDDGEYLIGTVSVVTEWDVFGAFRVERIYTRYSDGRMPSVPVGGESWGIGVEVGL